MNSLEEILKNDDVGYTIYCLKQCVGEPLLSFGLKPDLDEILLFFPEKTLHLYVENRQIMVELETPDEEGEEDAEENQG